MKKVSVTWKCNVLKDGVWETLETVTQEFDDFRRATREINSWTDWALDQEAKTELPHKVNVIIDYV